MVQSSSLLTWESAGQEGHIVHLAAHVEQNCEKKLVLICENITKKASRDLKILDASCHPSQVKLDEAVKGF